MAFELPALPYAHDALADVKATVDVLKGQISRYKDVDYVDNDGNVHMQFAYTFKIKKKW